MNLERKVWIFIVVAGCCLLASCGKKEQRPGSAIYKTIEVSQSDAILSNPYPATVRGAQYVEIRPQVSGLITEICINEGEQVRKGTPLFIIDQVPYKAAVEVAVANVKSVRAKVATARLTTESKQELFAKNIVSRFDLQTAQNSLQEVEALLAQAQAEEANARNNLSYTIIKSPVNGVTSMIPYRVGALVNPSLSDPLVTVSNEDKMYVYFSISENQLLELAEESGSVTDIIGKMQPVGLELSNGNAYKIKGRVDAISGTVDAQTGSIGVRAVFDNPRHLLRNGGSARVIISSQKSNCMLIPKAATFEIQDKVYVYKVIEGKAVSAPIKPFKISDGTQYVVEEGLLPGDIIIAEGAGLLREGTPVNTHQQEH